MTPTTESNTTPLSWDLKPSGDLPRGRLSFTVAFGQGKRALVHVAHVGILERGDAAATSEVFDDGRVVVDRNADGEILGIEFLARKALGDLPEFHSAIKRAKSDRALLTAAYATAMGTWVRLAFYFDVAAEAGHDVAKHGLDELHRELAKLRGAFLRARPDMNRWKSRVEDERAALT